MKLHDICRFEFFYQARQGSTWLSFAVLLVFSSWIMIVSRPSDDDRFLNSPYDIAFLAALGGIVWLLMAPSIAGEAAARDPQTRMDSLMYAAPISKAEYLGGRFLAALVLNALILLALPAGRLLGQLSPTIEAGRLDQFRFATYATTHAVITLPFAFVCTAIQFASAALSRRTMASYLASVIIFIALSLKRRYTNASSAAVRIHDIRTANFQHCAGFVPGNREEPPRAGLARRHPDLRRCCPAPIHGELRRSTVPQNRVHPGLPNDAPDQSLHALDHRSSAPYSLCRRFGLAGAGRRFGIGH